MMMKIALATAAVLFAATPAATQHANDGHQDHQDHQVHGAQHGSDAHQAHDVVTSPADGEMTHGSPAWFTATFEHPMRLTSVSVAADGGDPMNVPVAASAATTRVTARLPQLAAGDYTLTWAAEGDDGHRMTGAVRFMVH
jgi:copper resistance protein C